MNTRTRNITVTALMAAVICVLGPISLPIGPVPISLTNFAIFLTLYILGLKRGLIAYAIYMLVGLVGLPVFSGFTGGPQKLFGPTGGYLIGFLPMAILAGLVIDRKWKNRVLSIIAMEASTWVLYIFGTAWLALSMSMTFCQALAAGVLPFMAWDFAKIVAVGLLGPVLKTRLARFTDPVRA